MFSRARHTLAVFQKLCFKNKVSEKNVVYALAIYRDKLTGKYKADFFRLSDKYLSCMATLSNIIIWEHNIEIAQYSTSIL